MLKFVLQLLLCVAVISTEKPDIFRNCVVSPEDVTIMHTCVLISQFELSAHETPYKRLAESVLEKSDNQLDPKFLSIVYNVTRAAVLDREQIRERPYLLLEFTSSRSVCLRHACRYVASICTPINDKADGICQAVFEFRRGIFDIEDSWCKNTGSAAGEAPPESRSVTP
ncbi:uncharacterized protein LOC119168480 isoform X2 [Rhipicephalus microplus]|uniref:uncharacterized protein LOC119168480 isoform X2 n=1 Tax=Rhipicephalus microplus TaxID=6941 RepID=UPI003F6D84B4